MDEITRLPRRQRGFTLPEMMLAIAIFALLALMTAQVLRSVLHTQLRFTEKTREMARAEQAIRLLERDISQATIRPMADETRINLADFSVTKGFPMKLSWCRTTGQTPVCYWPVPPLSGCVTA